MHSGSINSLPCILSVGLRGKYCQKGKQKFRHPSTWSYPHFSLSPLNSCHTGCFATVFKLFSFNNKLFVFCWFFIGNILINMLFKQGPISQTPANFMGPESCFMLSCCVCIQYQRPSVRTRQNFVCIAKNSVNSTITKIQRFCWEDLEAYYLLLTAIPHWLTLFLEHDQLKFFSSMFWLDKWGYHYWWSKIDSGLWA